jgi:hypothetical protein
MPQFEARAQIDFVQKNLCVWIKTNAGMGVSQHELIFVFKHGEGPHQNNFGIGGGARTRSNVWQYRGVNLFGKIAWVHRPPPILPIVIQ